MAWIKTIEEPDAEGDLKRIYAEQRLKAGDLANILKVHSIAPGVLAAHLGLYQAAMHASGRTQPRASRDDCCRSFCRQWLPLLSAAPRGRSAPPDEESTPCE